MGRLLVLAFVAGLFAGVTSWLAGEVILSRYKSDLNPSISKQSQP